MARRSILSATERDSLLALPESQDDLILHYSFTESDLSMIRQRRGDANRIGFAVQLCLLRYPGYALAGDMPVPAPVIQWIARQVQSDAAAWPQYGVRDETRRGANIFRRSAPISRCPRLACRIFVSWCTALPTSPCKPTREWYSRLSRWKPCGDSVSFCRRSPSSNGHAPKP